MSGAYRPSCVVNLRLVFDESLHVRTLGPPLPTTGVPDVAVGPVPLIAPQHDAAGHPTASFILGRVPIKANIELPGYRQAGQFSFDLPFRDLPIDPRTVRAAAVDVHLGAISDDDFAEGMVGPAVDGWRPSILRTRTADNEPNPDTLLMVGTVDEWNVQHDDSSSIVSIKGRDMRGILLDTPLTNDPKLAASIMEGLDLSLPIDTLIGTLLAVNPLFSDFVIRVNPAEWPNGIIPAVGATATVPRHRQGARGRRTGGRATPPSAGGTVNFWDMIVRLCYLVAAVPYFQGLDLRIRPQRTIYDQQDAGNPMNPAPFAGGAVRAHDVEAGTPITPPLAYRRLAYGRDVKSISFDRKMAGLAKPQTVVARSIDSNSDSRGDRRMLEGRWPPKDDTAARRQTASATKPDTQESILPLFFPGTNSVERLTELAHGAYEEIARREIGGQCSTKNLASFGGDNTDPDLLRLKPGDGVEFLVDTTNMTIQTPLISALTDHLRNGFEEQVALIAARIGDENLARVIVATSRGAIQEIPAFFRVQNVKFTWSCDAGIGIDFDFQNYVIPIFGTAPQAATATGAASTSGANPRRRRRVVTVYSGGTVQALEPISITGVRLSPGETEWAPAHRTPPAIGILGGPFGPRRGSR
jgi:hypothetical protein